MPGPRQPHKYNSPQFLQARDSLCYLSVMFHIIIACMKLAPLVSEETSSDLRSDAIPIATIDFLVVEIHSSLYTS